MLRTWNALAILALSAFGWAHAEPAPDLFDKILASQKGFARAWPQEWETAFRERSYRAITNLGSGPLRGTTWGESEKDLYPRTMFHLLNGNREAALKVLQQPDYQAADHQHTLLVDYYWCFTIKGQVRKLFFFGEDLDPGYRAKMLEAGRIWTEEDPLRRPHPVYGKGDPNKGVWGPENKGSWVDVRDTDNLRAMRDTSVYLLAEATHNEATRQLYKSKIISYVRMLYHTGMREWDSSNYHSHSLSPYHNLYDFAKDAEVKLLAKAALDWLYAAGALKYYRGGFGGPRLRDYAGASVVFGGNAIHPLELYFGDGPGEDPHPDRDDLYQITSAYRPPQAVVSLARKQFHRPVEILSSKPPYQLWDPVKPFEPGFHETLYIGETYQMGSMVSAEPEAAWNPSVFNFMAFNSQRGVDYIAINTTPIWEHSVKKPGDQVAQQQNMLIWLRPASPEQPFYFQWPTSAQVDEVGGWWFIRLEKTWVAIFPINLGPRRSIQAADKVARVYPEESFSAADTTGEKLAGFGMLVGESRSFPIFQSIVLREDRLELTETGTVKLKGLEGATLELIYNRENDLPQVVRDGTRHNWAQHLALYQPVRTGAPISLGWKDGTLRVNAGGKSFLTRVDVDGKVISSERWK